MTLFTAEHFSYDDVINYVESKITNAQNQSLLQPFTDEYVQNAVLDMHPDKSPGPDGMNLAFYQKFWHVVDTDITKACLRFIRDYSFPDGLNVTSIVLIPKKKQPEFFIDVRPISLYNVLYKIVANMLANRMKMVLGSIISNSQSAFVLGRAISDNVLISA